MDTIKTDMTGRRLTDDIVSAIAIEPLRVNPLGNPDLKWRVCFTTPRIGAFSLPFETRYQAERVFEHVVNHGKLPLLYKGNIVPVKPMIAQ